MFTRSIYYILFFLDCFDCSLVYMYITFSGWLSPEQMADSGGQPQLTQVSAPAIRGVGYYWPWTIPFATHPISNLPRLWAPAQFLTSLCCLPFLILLSQPGKLTEAFKYFLQGMGYSEYGGQLRIVRHPKGSNLLLMYNWAKLRSSRDSWIDTGRQRKATNVSSQIKHFPTGLKTQTEIKPNLTLFPDF